MSLVTRDIDYTHGSVALRGRLAWDDALQGPRPAVAVAHTWAGRGDFENGRAEQLAALGYVGFALDLYGAGVLGNSPEENTGLMAPFMEDRKLLQARMAQGISVMREQPEVDATKTAAVGYCFGGLSVLDLARSGSDVLGVISMHGLFAPAGNIEAGSPISARILCLHGYDDPMAQPDTMIALASELSAAGADWQVHAYGNTLHAFTNPAANSREAGTLYDAAADKRSWQSLQNFLTELF